ncbi:hypothetical protein LJK87_35535 [Paenibacillus sp. P25]|nr:hypothetical protein LJK87_35535 [Paenibacillus sp. P25]
MLDETRSIRYVNRDAARLLGGPEERAPRHQSGVVFAGLGGFDQAVGGGASLTRNRSITCI